MFGMPPSAAVHVDAICEEAIKAKKKKSKKDHDKEKSKEKKEKHKNKDKHKDKKKVLPSWLSVYSWSLESELSVSWPSHHGGEHDGVPPSASDGFHLHDDLPLSALGASTSCWLDAATMPKDG
ncbi:unnamed protein product [Toxocara canis]|uniref:Mediator of RNA polymerase II transcription subunit 19 n=1 Tax=Toxocara canis TaxID=6265 RepID=A0A183VEK8_TOXCA|nr:unnamed protein product [Toxocara canis]